VRRILQDISAFILYLTLTVIVFSGVVTGRGVFFAGDISQHYIPWETFIDNEIEAGHFPQWDPSFFGGHPIHAEGQSGILYPVTRFVYSIFDGALAFSIDMLLHLALGGFFLYLLTRNLKLGFYPALYAGAVFTLAGYPVSLIVNAPILRSVTWIPLITMLVWNIWHGSGVKGGTWLAIVIAIQIFSGSIQVVAMTLILILFMSVILFISCMIEKKTSLMPVFIIIVIALPLAFIISGIQILPTNELYQQSFIHLDLKEDVTYSFSTYHLLDMLIPPYWAQNPNVLMRDAIPFQMTLFLYLGIVPFIMVLTGFFVSRSPWVWRLIAIIGLLMGLGEHTFFYPLMAKILPPLGNFRAPDRFLAFYALGASILAGYGFRNFVGRELPPDPRIKRKWYAFWGIFALLMFIFALAVDYIIPGTLESLYTGIRETLVGWSESENTIQNIGIILRSASLEILFAIVLVAGIVVFAIHYRKSNQRTLIIGILVFFLSITESVVYLKINPGTKLITTSFYKSMPASVEAIFQSERVDKETENDSGNSNAYQNNRENRSSEESEAQKNKKLFRIAAVGYTDYSKTIFGETPLLLWYHGGGRIEDFIRFREILNPNFGNIYGLDYISGISSLYTSSWNQYIDMLEFQEGIFKSYPEYFGPRVHLWDLSGVKYIMSNQEIREGRLEKIHSGEVFVYKNRRALPRAFVIHPEKVLPEDQTVRDSMMKGELDLSKYLVLDSVGEDFEKYESYPDMMRYSPATVDEYKPTRIKISGVSIADGYLILTDAFYPGWGCQLNGKKIPIAKAYCYFRAVPIKAGKYEAVFTFKSSSFRLGEILSIFGIVIWIFLLVISQAGGSRAEGLVDKG